MKYEYKPAPWHGVIVDYARRSRWATAARLLAAVAVLGALPFAVLHLVAWIMGVAHG